MYVGSLLLHVGDVAIAVCFLALTSVYLFIVITTLTRYTINYRRNRDVIRSYYWRRRAVRDAKARLSHLRAEEPAIGAGLQARSLP